MHNESADPADKLGYTILSEYQNDMQGRREQERRAHIMACTSIVAFRYEAESG